MADFIPAADLRVGDVMLDPNGDLRIAEVRGGVAGQCEVRVVAVDGGFEANWLFDPADLCRVVTRPAVTS
jgi:hypothetical protein